MHAMWDDERGTHVVIILKASFFTVDCIFPILHLIHLQSIERNFALWNARSVWFGFGPYYYCIFRMQYGVCLNVQTCNAKKKWETVMLLFYMVEFQNQFDISMSEMQLIKNIMHCTAQVIRCVGWYVQRLFVRQWYFCSFQCTEKKQQPNTDKETHIHAIEISLKWCT